MKNNFKIYILSLKDDIDRRIKISEDLIRNSLEFDFFDAPDGRKNFINRSARSNLSNNEAACALGHLKIYEEFISLNLDYALILEDDVKINIEQIHNLKKIIDCVDKNSSSIYLLGGQDGIAAYRYFVGITYQNFGDLKIFKSFKSEDKISRACCYIITKNAALRIMEKNSGLTYVADDWASFYGKKGVENYFISEPPIFFHPLDLSKSHLENQRLQKKESKFKSLIVKYKINHLKHIFIYIYKIIILALKRW